MLGRLGRVSGILLVCGLFLFFLCQTAQSSDFPKKPVRIIVTADAGGGEDTAVRGIAPHIQKHLGTTVIIENMGGAGGKIAFERFAKTEPDGYNLISYTFPKSVIIEMMGKSGFRTKDYTPVFAFTSSFNGLMVHADTWKTFDEFLKAAKSRTLKAGLSGRGSISHLAGVLAVNELGINVNWVPFDGAAGSLTSLAGKHIDFTVGHITSAVSLIKAGKIRPLMHFGDHRDPFFSDVPIPKDLGFNMTCIPAIRGIEAPPNTPPEIVKVLEEAGSKAIKEPAYHEWSKNRWTTVDPMDSREYGKAIAEVYPLVERLMKYLKE